jgi:hypothetical protein
MLLPKHTSDLQSHGAAATATATATATAATSAASSAGALAVRIAFCYFVRVLYCLLLCVGAGMTSWLSSLAAAMLLLLLLQPGFEVSHVAARYM